MAFFKLIENEPITIVSPLSSHVYKFDKRVREVIESVDESDANHLRSISGLEEVGEVKVEKPKTKAELKTEKKAKGKKK